MQFHSEERGDMNNLLEDSHEEDEGIGKGASPSTHAQKPHFFLIECTDTQQREMGD